MSRRRRLGPLEAFVLGLVSMALLTLVATLAVIEAAGGDPWR